MNCEQENKLPKGKENKASENPLEETTIYCIEGRSFVVKPVFKKENANTFGAILFRLCRRIAKVNRKSFMKPADKWLFGAV